MASSRIFIRGLPPSLSEDDFRRHFSQQYGITDAKFFPQRRIGYVGYKSPEEAAEAVKYFHKTFVKMSRIAVEMARPVGDAPQKLPRRKRPTGSEPANVTHSNKVQLGEPRNPLKRKRPHQEPVPEESTDPKAAKLAEYLKIMTNRGNSNPWEDDETGALPLDGSGGPPETEHVQAQSSEEDSDNEYQALKRPVKRKAEEHDLPASDEETKMDADRSEVKDTAVGLEASMNGADVDKVATAEHVEGEIPATLSDSDWLRSRTSRLLGLLDEEEEGALQNLASDEEAYQEKGAHRAESGRDQSPERSQSSLPSQNGEPARVESTEEKDHNRAIDTDEDTIRQSRRLFLRNLPYDASEDDLRAKFAVFGELEEVHIPMDTVKGVSKGFAYLLFSDGGSAAQAYAKADGKTFQGRLLHILPAAAKRDTKLDDYAISQLPLKKQKAIRRKAEAATSSFSWNSLYMNADAVMSSVSDRLGVDKAVLLDPTSADAAVKQALAETHVIQETKSYFAQNGVDLEAFKRRARGDTAILVKNFPYGTTQDVLRKMFEEHGKVLRFLMPPSGTIAIVEFSQPPEARAAFASLAYRKIRDSVLFLEKAPKDLFTTAAANSRVAEKPAEVPVSAADLHQSTADAEAIDTTTLFVRNLNFSTTSEQLAAAFKPLEGFLSARVKTKTNPKRPGATLSMGFGFLEFRTHAHAHTALAAMQGHELDGHALALRASHAGALDAAEQRAREDRAKKLAARGAKLVIKNLPFEAGKREVRALLRPHGRLRTVRVPRKMAGGGARGFAFAEFASAADAAGAVAALGSTHLLGRKLVLEYADEEAEGAEEQIERMARKVGEQTDRVALQKLVGGGRKKFEVGGDEGTQG